MIENRDVTYVALHRDGRWGKGFSARSAKVAASAQVPVDEFGAWYVKRLPTGAYNVGVDPYGMITWHGPAGEPATVNEDPWATRLDAAFGEVEEVAVYGDQLELTITASIGGSSDPLVKDRNVRIVVALRAYHSVGDEGIGVVADVEECEEVS
jgi:hypothetical protein